MSRYKTFDATGIATGGRLYAGDLNAIQDRYADLSNFAQTVDVATLRIGETALMLTRHGAGEARISGRLRTDGLIRPLGGFVGPTLTTAQRNALPVADRPYGLIILNVTRNLYEFNAGTDVAPDWRDLVPEPMHVQPPLGGKIDWWRPSSSIPIPAEFDIADGRTIPGASNAYGFSITLPDMRNRYTIGANIARPDGTAGVAIGDANFDAPAGAPGIGGTVGANGGVLTINDIPAHNHGGGAHNHGGGWHDHGGGNHNHGGGSHNHGGGAHGHAISDPGHAHSITDPGHGHSVGDPGHQHSQVTISGSLGMWHANAFASGTKAGYYAGAGAYHLTTNTAFTGISIGTGYTGVGVQPAGTGISVQGSAAVIATEANIPNSGNIIAGAANIPDSGVIIATQGGGARHENRPSAVGWLPLVRVR